MRKIHHLLCLPDHLICSSSGTLFPGPLPHAIKRTSYQVGDFGGNAQHSASFATANCGSVVASCFPNAFCYPGSVRGRHGNLFRMFASTEAVLEKQYIDDCALGASPHVAIALWQRMISTAF